MNFLKSLIFNVLAALFALGSMAMAILANVLAALFPLGSMAMAMLVVELAFGVLRPVFEVGSAGWGVIIVWLGVYSALFFLWERGHSCQKENRLSALGKAFAGVVSLLALFTFPVSFALFMLALFFGQFELSLLALGFSSLLVFIVSTEMAYSID